MSTERAWELDIILVLYKCDTRSLSDYMKKVCHLSCAPVEK